MAGGRGRAEAERLKRREPWTVRAVQLGEGHQGELEVAIATAVCSLATGAFFLFLKKLEENHFTM